MDSKTTAVLNDKFIELNRTFHEVSQFSTDDDIEDIGPALHLGNSLHWADLIKEDRLIILSEAGAGKTAEIRNAARILREEGKHAFFLRLELIADDFELAFDIGSYEAFKEWLASGEEGWLFLDSVDEARLQKPNDFERAIRKLSSQISTAKDRTHVTITSRPEAWRPKTDLALCTNLLPKSPRNRSESNPSSQHTPPNGSVQTKTKKDDESQQVFKIVALDDLTSHQIEIFAKAQGIEDSRAFLDAIERADARLFTSRPQDLLELTDFWIVNGQIGTRLELVQSSIDRRLAERDQNRADARPISKERVRWGARLLAAATTLTKNPTIRVPDGADNLKGMEGQSVLHEWDSADLLTLLSRPIFDEAIYSVVRFHHRSVREYLTAEWFSELLKRETSRRKIESLFFRNQYGMDIVVPSLRPILPWLVIFDEKIRERVRIVAPEIFFEGGDPSQLPLELRRHILCEVCKQMAESNIGRTMRDYAAVQRFANPDLTNDVRDLIRKYAGNEDLQAFLLRMVWIGQLADALPEVMAIALTPTAGEYCRIAAFRAANAIGSDEDQERVRQSFLRETSKINRKWLAELLDGINLSWGILSWLFACLENCDPEEPYASDYLAYNLSELFANTDIELLPQIATGLNKLLSCPPLIDMQHCQISARYQWLIASACKVAERLIASRHSASLESDTLSILSKFSMGYHYLLDRVTDIKADFSKLVPAWPALNRTLFWFEVQTSRAAVDKQKGERLIDFWQVSSLNPFWRFDEHDFEYIAGEISLRTLQDDKLIALSLAHHLYRAAKRPPAWRKEMKKLVEDNNELSEQLATYLRPPAQPQARRRWKLQEAKWKKKAEAARKKKREIPRRMARIFQS